MSISNMNGMTSSFPAYIISPCSYGAYGLSRFIRNSEIIPFSPLTKATNINLYSQNCRLIFFLPEEAALLLSGLSVIARIVNTQQDRRLSIVVLCSSPVYWIWYTLLHLVDDQSVLSNIRFASSKLSIFSLGELLNTSKFYNYPNIEKHALFNSFTSGAGLVGLTKAEFSALLASLKGIDVNSQAQSLGLSKKTLYNQKKSAIKKIIMHYPAISAGLPGGRFNMLKCREKNKLSRFEEDFIHSIHTKDIFFVYQPITDADLSLQGFELLCRWKKNEDLLVPGDFLSKLESDFSWMSLTAYAINDAIKKINYYKGGFYFSINLPPEVINHESLYQMVLMECKKLLRAKDRRRLIFEVSELTNIGSDSAVAVNISKLRNYGFKVLLDDCFSQGSIFFPVRSSPFNGYKIDMDIIKDFKRDAHALSLLKSLAYYCRLTGSSCIAEGVESSEVMSELSGLGITQFQGFFISKPVLDEEIIHLVERLKNKN
ncbi:EAL domain-containing protein [Erwiniaceae bacterium CAU 1747]